MSSRLQAKIYIGGTLPQRLVPDLCQAIADDEAGFDWEVCDFPQTADELLTLGIEDDYLCLKNEQAPWGLLRSLMAFCEAHALPYDAYTEGNSELDRGIYYYRPVDGVDDCDCDTSFFVATTADGDHLIHEKPIVKLRAELAQSDTQDAVALLQHVREVLDAEVFDIAELPPFTIEPAVLASQ